MTTYRPEIDGLRAVAVLPVILFHAGFPWFSGGFVGVDVFFVISGYLITSIILGELKTDSFSLVQFYERRARRILPALFFVMACCIPFAWLWLIPRDFKDFGESLAAVATFSSNILFWLESGYFATEASLKPLLHTWSLAVEEQYYILFPLLLMAVWRLRRRWLVPVLCIGLLASLLLAQWGAYNKPSPAFYLLPTRAWELLMGALTAFYLSRRLARQPARHPGKLDELAGLCGLGLILAAIVGFDSTTPFPGLFALVPTLGAVLIILGATSGTITARVLGSRLPVAIGLISYSAYLWHQPLLAFGHYQSLHEPSLLMMGILCGLTLPLAYLTWRYVEQPFRDRSRFSRRQILTGSAVVASAFIVLGLGIRYADGVPQRLDPDVAEIVSLGTRYVDQFDADMCNRKRSETDLAGCILGDESNPVIAVIGDSHAYSVLHRLAEGLAQRGLGLVQYTKNGCPPAPRFASTEPLYCDQYIDAVLDDINRRDIRAVILLSRWSAYLQEEDFLNGLGGRELREDALYSTADVPFTAPLADRRAAVLGAYEQGVRALLNGNRTVHLVMPVPEQGWDVPRYLGRIAMSEPPGTDLPATPVAVYQRRHADLARTFAVFQDDPEVRVVQTANVFCNTPAHPGCIASQGGTSLYYDSNHLTDQGARLLVPAILASIDADTALPRRQITGGASAASSGPGPATAPR